jgi:hypothetical protein
VVITPRMASHARTTNGAARERRRPMVAEDRGFEPLRAFTPNPLSKRAP